MSKEERRKRILSDADIEVLVEALRNVPKCHACTFTQEEVQFVRDWLDTAKTAKSEIVKLVVRGSILLAGLICGVVTASKLGWFK